MMKPVLGALAMVALSLPTLSGAPGAAAASAPHCQGHVATIVGRPGARVVEGTSGRDVIYARSHNSVVAGGGGDLVCAHRATHVQGGRGNDRIVSRTASSVRISGGPGDDRITTSAGTTSAVVGGPGDGRILNLKGSPYLRAEPGHDAITNRAKATVVLDLRYSPVSVRVDLGGPHPSVTDQGHASVDVGPAGGIYVAGSSYDDVVRGSKGRDQVDGRGGNDLLEGRGGHDKLDGGTGTNTVVGGSGGDHLSVGGDSVAAGGSGRDTFVIYGDRAMVSGGTGNDVYSLSGLVPGVGPTVDDTEGTSSVALRLGPPTSGAWSHVAVDMVSGSLTADGQTSALPAPLTAFAALDLVVDRPAGSWEVAGTDSPDDIRVNLGLASTAPVVVHGLEGDDVLLTGAGDDTLDGGAGTDFAVGGPGTNTCVSIESGFAGNPTGCSVSTP